MIEELIKNQCQDFGGIAVIGGFFVSVLYLIFVMSLEGKLTLFGETQYFKKILGFFVGIAILGIVCYIDDKKDIPALVKLIAQIIAATIVAVSGIRIDDIILPIFNQEIDINGIWSYILTVRLDCRYYKCY